MIKLFSLLIILTLSASLPVLSQSDSSDSTSSSKLSTDTTISPTPIDQLKSDYFYQLEQYRLTKQQFVLDQAEYLQLLTLATKDKLLQSYKNILVSRGNTLLTYLYPLEHLLHSTQGIDIADKQKAIDQVRESSSQIKLHLQILSSLSEQEELSEQAKEFETQNIPLFMEASYRTLSALSIGRIQSIADQVKVSRDHFSQEVVAHETDARKKTSMERGIKEVDEFHKQATAAITQARDKYSAYDVTDRRQSYNPQNIYNSITDTLSPAYTSLQRSLDYLLELERSR